METVYLVEAGEYVWEGDETWEGESNTWPPLVLTRCQQAFYPDIRYIRFSASDATEDIMEYFGIDGIEEVADATEMRWHGQYGIVSSVEVTEDLYDELEDLRGVPDELEDLISYDRDDIHIAAIKYGSMSHFEY